MVKTRGQWFYGCRGQLPFPLLPRRLCVSCVLIGCGRAQECEEIRERVQQVVREMDLDEAKTVFTTE